MHGDRTKIATPLECLCSVTDIGDYMSVAGGKPDEIDEKADILCVAGTARQIGGLLNRLPSRF